jgi:hypothetical protein
MTKESKLELLYQNIENNRQLLEEAAKELRSKIKDLNEHVLGGSVLAKYLDTLAKLNDQLIEVEKLRLKAELKEKASAKDEMSIVKNEIENEDLIGTTFKKAN